MWAKAAFYACYVFYAVYAFYTFNAPKISE